MLPDIYLDYAAATPVRPEVMAAMTPYFSSVFANPSAIHKPAVLAKQAVGRAREQVAGLIGATSEEIVFTSGATEAINLAIRGILDKSGVVSRHVITTTAEHAATLKTLAGLKCEVTVVPVDKVGQVSVKDVLSAIRPDTVLISIIFANNEVGTLNPVLELGRALARFKKNTGEKLPLLHLDAAQAAPYLVLDVNKLHCDLMSFSAGKMGGPKGVGALYVKKNTVLSPLIFGGGQEGGYRAGTENVPGVVGFGRACELVRLEQEKTFAQLHALRQFFIEKITLSVPGVVINGHPTEVAPHIVNLQLPGLEAEEIVLRLDAAGIYISAASACTNSHERSHVLRAMGLSEKEVASSIRLSFGLETTEEDLMRTVKILAQLIGGLN